MFAVALMGMVFGVACGITGTSLYYSGKLVKANRRIAQLEREKTPPRHG